MMVCIITDLPDLVVLELFSYFKPVECIYFFFDFDERWNSLLNEKQFVANVNYLSLLSSSTFDYICSRVLPRVSSNIISMSINGNFMDGCQLRKIFHNLSFSKLKKLKLLCVLEPDDFELCFKQTSNLTDLTVNNVNESAAEQFSSVIYKYLHTLTKFECRDKLNLKLNANCHYSLTTVTLCLQSICDLWILFNYLPWLECLQIGFNFEYKMNDDECSRFESCYNGSLVHELVPRLTHFKMISTMPQIDYSIFDRVIQSMIYLQSLSFDYRVHVSRSYHRSVSGLQLAQTLYPLANLTHLEFRLSVRVELGQDISELFLTYQCQWSNISWHVDDVTKLFYVYTRPWMKSVSFTIFDYDRSRNIEMNNFQDVTLLCLFTTASLDRVIKHFPSITHLKLSTTSYQSPSFSTMEERLRTLQHCVHLSIFAHFAALFRTTVGSFT
ncbi:unnamed protein product [Didymodactylos carnosus]|uniref:F-box domain-containing protein n=1 Tax=Didymodactylos carnosus TaxID=1234261 RepID=A0A815S3Z5_9BILA|nr:unnamed protein product [Didymodactylos carnosus]CAF4347730.1 unnamed protein product [Didymodactylos carnosus]